MDKVGARGAERENTLRRYLTNMQMIYKPIVEEAIEKSGRTDICIDPNPMPADHIGDRYDTSYRDRMIENFFSVYVDTTNRMGYDCSDFWRVYDQLEKSTKWSVYLKLARD